jgi:hypothetical protein
VVLQADWSLASRCHKSSEEHQILGVAQSLLVVLASRFHDPPVVTCGRNERVQSFCISSTEVPAAERSAYTCSFHPQVW